VRDDAYHRGYVDVPSERVWDLPHIKRAIAWASFGRECDETAAVPTWSPPAAGWA
jgi:hypothetical protein